MHLFAIDTRQYREPVAANRIHNAADEILRNPFDFNGSELIERIRGCWEDAVGILQALNEAEGCTLMSYQPRAVITPAMVVQELRVLSDDLVDLATEVSTLMSTPEGFFRWDTYDTSCNSEMLGTLLFHLRMFSVVMNNRSVEVARAARANPQAMQVNFKGEY